VLQQSNGAAETIAQKIKGTPENVFFFIFFLFLEYLSF